MTEQSPRVLAEGLSDLQQETIRAEDAWCRPGQVDLAHDHRSFRAGYKAAAESRDQRIKEAEALLYRLNAADLDNPQALLRLAMDVDTYLNREEREER